TRGGYVPAASELGGADGVGLLDCPAMDDVLADITGESGGVRDRIMEAAFAYVRHVGTTATDTAALAARLAEAALHHRGEGEVAGYGIPSLITWVMVRVAAQERDAALTDEIFAFAAGPTPGGGAEAEKEAEGEAEEPPSEPDAAPPLPPPPEL